ncbi:MAG: MFS transporter [Planctomycetes bacterium]|nr:MFS transporter [Planctomycetota bacterium]
MNHLRHNTTSLKATLLLTGLASTGTSVIWNGLPFVAKRDYGFSESETLSLYLLIGFVYLTGALISGRCTRLLQQYISMRAIMGALLLAVTFVCSLPLFFEETSSWVIWSSGGVAGFCSSWLWPIVESYLVVGRHGKEMRRAIGWWNLVWMCSVASVMLAMAPFMDEHASMIIVGLGVMNLFAICVLPMFPKNPPAHEPSVAKEHVPESYKSLLKGARVLLPLSYVINGVLSPLLPFVLTGIAIDITWQTPVVAIWMVTRVLATAVMWKTGGWHGKWSTLWLSLGAMATGFVCILAASGLPILIVGLTLFGIGLGVTYYAALYYAMAVGSAQVDAGGKHEAFIGGGYMAGPVLGLLSLQLAPKVDGSGFDTTIYIVLAIFVIATMALTVFWRKAR